MKTTKPFFFLSKLLGPLLILAPFVCIAQVETSFKSLKLNTTSQDLFGSEEPIDMVISGNIKELMDDRGDDPQYHPFKLIYSLEDRGFDSVNISVKTRGNFRKMKSNCVYPPLRLNFSDSNVPEDSYFHGQDKLKLVTPCRDDKYVIREYLVYKIYQLVTEKSFQARLVRMVFDDTIKNSRSDQMYGFLIEDENKLAERNAAVLTERERIQPENTKRREFLQMAVFEYLIGNTDWSIQYLQNIKLLLMDSTGIPVAVPYDFDHAGIVAAPYAKPAEQLKMTSVRQRRYRGFCIEDMSEFQEIFDLYNRIKPDIYEIYSENDLLDEKSKKSTIKFLDKFYKTINDPKKSERDFTYPCLPGGTGNVVIRGMQQ